MTSGYPVTMSKRPVVVGYDGSDQARVAMRWAAREATSRQCPLLVVEAVGQPVGLDRGQAVPPNVIVEERTLRERAGEHLAEVIEETRQAWEDLEIGARVELNRPATALAEVAEAAELVVVGASGRTALPRMLLGSTAAELAHRCERPLVVVREARDGPVVVGVDGSATSAGAIGFAFDFADRHGTGLVAVHAWADLPLDALAPVRVWDEDMSVIRGQGEQVLAASLAEHIARHPGVPVTQLVSFEPPARALAEQADGAALLVVGSHGRGALRRALLGSVSHAMIYHAPCTVAVVRAVTPEESAAR
jgi:nucleotide-binding universal stress UspA family protein